MIKSNIIKQMLEDTINKYIVTENNKSHYFKELIDSAYILILMNLKNLFLLLMKV